jgi:hypothetical protein
MHDQMPEVKNWSVTSFRFAPSKTISRFFFLGGGNFNYSLRKWFTALLNFLRQDFTGFISEYNVFFSFKFCVSCWKVTCSSITLIRAAFYYVWGSALGQKSPSSMVHWVVARSVKYLSGKQVTALVYKKKQDTLTYLMISYRKENFIKISLKQIYDSQDVLWDFCDF